MTAPEIKVCFLHIPKTAGQSVHQMLTEGFGEETICPARVNEEIVWYPSARLRKYRVFSGHFDWTLLDVVRSYSAPVYFFTVLRDPLERILSFYFYLRNEGKRLAPEVLRLPEKRGVRFAYEATVEEYFLSKTDPALRSFIDDFYDNFYTFYFAGRTMRARRTFLESCASGSLPMERIYSLAKDNLTTLNGVFSTNDIGRVAEAIAKLSGNTGLREKEFRQNENRELLAKDRMSEFLRLGATPEVIERLKSFSAWDNRLFAELSPS